MTKKEAMKILCNGEYALGEIYSTVIEVTPLDIKENLESNDYELDLDWTQDLTQINPETWDRELYQGHSLDEVELDD